MTGNEGAERIVEAWSSSALPLLEREGELVALRAVVEGAASGSGRVVVIEATAGMGKSRLVKEARAVATAHGFRVLVARGGELEGEFAFGVVRQLFESLIASAPQSARFELLSGAAAYAAPLFDPEQLGAAEAGDPSFVVLHGLYWLAANVAYDQPTLLAVEDLHWADGPSLRWLAYLAARVDGCRCLS